MSSELSPENELFLRDKIASGLFASRDDAMAAGIEMLRKRDEMVSQIAASRRQLDTGELCEYDDESLVRRFEELKRRAGRASR